jgi:hypothetical protein
MGYRFSIIKRVFENDSLIAFIDLLGTRKLYGSTLGTEQQAKKTLWVLLGQFDICFSKYFREDEIEQNFDVSIFADSIVVSQRKNTPNLVERLVDFSLGYQADLLLKEVPTRTTIIRDRFFSFKMIDPSRQSILGSRYTNISLCGGRGIKYAHNTQEGLPIGVYVAKTIKNGLSAKQKERLIPVRNDEGLFFIKQKHDVFNFLPDEAVDLLTKKPSAGIKAIRHSLKASHLDEDAVKKLLPWVLVHLGRKNEIVRSIGCTGSPKNPAPGDPRR